MNITFHRGQTEPGNKVLIGSEEYLYFSNDSQEEFEAFLELDRDTKEIKTFDSCSLFVRSKGKEEWMRKQGAAYRSMLNKDAESMQVIGTPDDCQLFLEGFLLASYQFDKYLTEKKEYALKDIHVDEDFSTESEKELLSITSAVYWARDMVNEPVSFLTAEQLSEEIKALSTATDLNVNVLEKAQIESLKMGGILAVNQGSIDPPTFTIVEYKPSNAKNDKPIVLVGKGVVYDTGGLSLKPTPNSMDSMKADMGGAACVGGAIYLAALQQLPVHLIALIPASDNRPGLNAYAPGDIITMHNGSTVEVLNTDAEGRMLLADALSYSQKYDPELVIDAATLTGSAYRAIGTRAGVTMGNANDRYFELLDKAGHEVHERIVRMPFWDDYFDEMKSSIADLNNLGGPTAGMITAGKFLEHFVKAPYIHMDIAGPAFLAKNEGYRTKGGSGYGVRLVYQFLKNYCND